MSGSPPLAHLDTQVVVWLKLPRRDLLSTAAVDLMETASLAVSPMVLVELTYLHEVGRTAADGPTALESLRDDLGVQVDDTPFPRVAAVAHGHPWTRDPFDRLIAAQVMAAGAKLVTADRELRKRVPGAVW